MQQGATAPPQPVAPPDLHRVKLYKLNETGGWDDKGTGLVSVGPMECANHQSNTVGLCVISEETSKMLMVHRILQDDSYNRQDETIITWTDPDIGTDVALSFQEAQGCSAIWEHIMRAQSDSDPKHPDHRRRVIDEFDGVVSHLDGDYPHGDVAELGGGHVELPAAEMGNLDELSKILAHVPPMQRERVAQVLQAPGYLRKLLDLFRQCEDLEDTASLQHLFRIMRSMVMLNDTQLLDELLKEEHVMDVIGCLEYDPDLTTAQQHRQFLSSAVVFKEVVPITSQDVLAKIHQTYRIQYLKDVILPRSLDDATYATLSSLMLFNNVDVVLGLYQDAAFLPRLFHSLKSHAPGDTEWDDLVAFLQEFCSLAKHLQLQHRQNLWNKMTQLGMFEVITRILRSSTPAVKLRATDILLSALAHDPMPLRNFLASPNGRQLLNSLVVEFVSSDESGLPEQIAELLKMLVDPETMEGALDKSEFMEVFYTECVENLIAPVGGSEQQQQPANAKGSSSAAEAAAGAAVAPAPAAPAAAAGGAGSDEGSRSSSKGGKVVPASTIGLIVDLLCFCVQHHAFWAKYHVLRKHVVEKVLKLLQRKERWLVVAGVRFLRTCIGTKDDFYLRHLIKNDLLSPVMDVFFANGDRYNLLNSAVLEMVEFIRKENLKLMIEHVVEKFGSRFDDVTYVDTFKQLQLKWEQSKEAAQATAAGGSSEGGGGADAPGGVVGGRLFGGRQRRLRRDDRDLEKDEEDYFSEDSVEDEAPATAAAGGEDGKPGAVSPTGAPAAAAGAAGDGSSKQQQQDPVEGRVAVRLKVKPQGDAAGGQVAAAAGAAAGAAGLGSSKQQRDTGGAGIRLRMKQQGDAATNCVTWKGEASPGGGSSSGGVGSKAAAAAGAAADAAVAEGLGPLVPYGDDEDDEENAPPPAQADSSRHQQPSGGSPQQQQPPLQLQQQQQTSPPQQQQPAQVQVEAPAAPAAQQQQAGASNHAGSGPQQQQPDAVAGSPASPAAQSPSGSAGSGGRGSQGELTPSKRNSGASDGPAAAGSPQSPQAKRPKQPAEA